MKNFKPSFFSLVSVIVVFMSFSRCKADTVSDVRDPIVGSYSGTMEMLALTDLENVLEEHNKRIFSVAKNETDSSAIDIIIEGSIIKAINVTEESSVFYFDIESQSTAYDDGEKVVIEGYDYFKLKVAEYNGIYDSRKNEIKFAIVFDAKEGGSNEDIGEVLICVTGIKK